MFFAKYLSYVLILVGVFTAYMAFVSVFRKDKNQLRTKQISIALSHQESEDKKTTTLASVFKLILTLFGIKIENQKAVSTELSKAGYSTPESLIYFLFFKRIIQPIFLVIGAVIIVKVAILGHIPLKENLGAFFIGAFVTFIGTSGSSTFLKNSATKRGNKIIATFPDALDLLLICVESGLGVDAAFARVCKEMKDSHPVVAGEFEKTRFEMTMMGDRVQALQNFSDRTGLGPVRSLVSSLIQAERFGTSLVDTIRMIAEEQRTDRMLAAENKAARLPALITLPLIFFILPALFCIIIGPAVIGINQKGGVDKVMSGGR